MRKLLKIAEVRDILDAHFRGEVTYSRMVEMLNEKANENINRLERKEIRNFKKMIISHNNEKKNM